MCRMDRPDAKDVANPSERWRNRRAHNRLSCLNLGTTTIARSGTLDEPRRVALVDDFL